jgi:hypothetical protein
MDAILGSVQALWKPGDRLHIHVAKQPATAPSADRVYPHTGVPFAYFKRFFQCVQSLPGSTSRTHMIIHQHSSSTYYMRPYYQANYVESIQLVSRWAGTCVHRPGVTVYVDLIRPSKRTSPAHAGTRTHLVERWTRPPYCFDKVCSGKNRPNALQSAPTFHVSIGTDQVSTVPTCLAGSLDLFQRVHENVCDIHDHSQVAWVLLEKNST